MFDLIYCNFLLIFADISKKNKQSFKFFFWFLKVLIKGYFRAKFQLPNLSLSKFSLGGRGNFYPPTPSIHCTSIKKPIQNRVNRLSVLVYSKQDDNSKRYKSRRYYFPKGFIKNFNIVINGKDFYDQSIDYNVK